MCGRGHFEKISFNFKILTVHWVVFSVILSNRFKCTNIYKFWHRNISNIGAHEETWNFNISALLIYFVNVFNPSSQFKMSKIYAGRVNKMCFEHIYSTFQSMSVQTHQSLMLIDFNFAKIWKHPDRPLLAAFAYSTVSWFQVDSNGANRSHFATQSFSILICTHDCIYIIYINKYMTQVTLTHKTAAKCIMPTANLYTSYINTQKNSPQIHYADCRFIQCLPSHPHPFLLIHVLDVKQNCIYWPV